MAVLEVPNNLACELRADALRSASGDPSRVSYLPNLRYLFAVPGNDGARLLERGLPFAEVSDG